MQVTVRMLGVPGVSTAKWNLRFEQNTLDRLVEQLASEHPKLRSLRKVIVPFVNGEAADRNLERVTLEEGDTVMLVVPISGG